MVRTVFPHNAVEICDPKNDNEFKVNVQCLKPFLKKVPQNETAMGLFDQMYQ